MRYLVGPSHAKALPRGFRTASIRCLQPCLRKVSFRLLGLSLGLTGAIDGVPLDLQWGGTKHSTGRESRAKWALPGGRPLGHLGEKSKLSPKNKDFPACRLRRKYLI